MRVAVCFWGLLRALLYTGDSIQRHVYEPLAAAGFNVSTFVHTFDHGMHAGTNTALKLFVRPDFFTVESQARFDASMDYSALISGFPAESPSQSRESLRNHVRALYSLRQVGRAVQAELDCGASYDWVVLLRPDLLLLNPLPVQLLFPPEPTPPGQLESTPNGPPLRPPHTLFTADFHRSCAGGEYNDRFAMAPPALALAYTGRFDSALLHATSAGLHAESFLYSYLTAAHIPVVEIPFRFRRLRAGGWTAKRDWYVMSPHRQLALHGMEQPSPSTALRFLFPTNPLNNANIFCSPNVRLHPWDPQLANGSATYTTTAATASTSARRG